jgi:hypothetical protein
MPRRQNRHAVSHCQARPFKDDVNSQTIGKDEVHAHADAKGTRFKRKYVL